MEIHPVTKKVRALTTPTRMRRRSGTWKSPTREKQWAWRCRWRRRLVRPLPEAIQRHPRRRHRHRHRRRRVSSGIRRRPYNPEKKNAKHFSRFVLIKKTPVRHIERDSRLARTSDVVGRWIPGIFEVVLVQLVVILNGLLRLSAAAVVIGQSFPATALSVVEFREKMESVRRRWKGKLNRWLGCHKRQSTKPKQTVRKTWIIQTFGHKCPWDFPTYGTYPIISSIHLTLTPSRTFSSFQHLISDKVLLKTN